MRGHQRQLTTEASMRKCGREGHLRCKSACCCIANAISIERLRTPTYKKRIHDVKMCNDMPGAQGKVKAGFSMYANDL